MGTLVTLKRVRPERVTIYFRQGITIEAEAEALQMTGEQLDALGWEREPGSVVLEVVKSERAEYVKCVRQTHAERKALSWCGQPLPATEWAFESIDHATYNEGRMLPCPDCLKAVAARLGASEGVLPEKTRRASG